MKRPISLVLFVQSSASRPSSRPNPRLQSQRDCVLQPRVARNELPWVERRGPGNTAIKLRTRILQQGGFRNHNRNRNLNLPMSPGSSPSPPLYLFSGRQSQRDCVLQPRVASNELPWVEGQGPLNPERVPAMTLRRRGPGKEVLYINLPLSQPQAPFEFTTFSPTFSINSS